MTRVDASALTGGRVRSSGARGRLAAYAGFVKLEHTVFSLPLIFAGTLLAGKGWPHPRLALLILLAAAGGRAVAMGLNRLIDAEIDARNPRTQQRELPRGVMRRGEGWGIVSLAGLLYVASAAAIAPICLWLSPIPVALFLVYPYLKRFTAFSHLGLGLAWSAAPLGGWLAASQSVAEMGRIGWLWAFSVLWVAGFDIIYATMDEAFDHQEGLHALPARLGKQTALRVAALLHALAFTALAVLCSRLGGLVSPAVLYGIGALLVWQHAIADRRPAFAFFQLNGMIGFLVFGLVLAGI